jgi:nucleotide-binding universal stress UspA family protein
MSVFRRILFPVDFSQRCAEAARSVAAMARQFNGKVILIHAIGDYEGLHTPDAPSPAPWINWLRDSATARLKSFGEPCLADFVVDRRVHEGEPAAAIVDYAAEHDVDLIMMPTHGRGIFRRLLLGSVTSKVLHDSSKPVWTTVHAPSSDSENGPVRSIVCAIDLTEASCHVLDTAARIASESSASLLLVHAISMPVTLAAGGVESCTPEVVKAIQDIARARVEEVQRKAGTKVEAHVEPGFVLPVVRAAIAKHHADLLVVGRGHLREPLSALRTDMSLLIRESGCPVLSV